MRREEVEAAFASSGWETVERGDEDVLKADAGRYAISTRESLWQAAGPLFQLCDKERDVVVGVRKVPPPFRAAELLERYGVPTALAHEFAREPPMVPPEEET